MPRTDTPLNMLKSYVIEFNFYPLEVVSRCRDPQLQVAIKYLHLFNSNQDICHPDM